MMMIARMGRTGLMLASLIALAACNQAAVGCSSEDALAPVSEILTSSIQDEVADRVKEAGDGYVSRAKIRAAVSQLKIMLEDVRTSKDDPNSTKKFCTASLRIRFPVEVINDAESAREAAELEPLSQLADSNDIDRRADSFSSEMEFNVQPTDDGTKVFAETETGTPMIQFASEVIAASLLRSQVERGVRATEQAIADQRTATLESVRTDNKIATQTILAAWQALSSGTRKQYLDSQRAWSRKKDADCRVEAAAQGTDPADIEAARLGCDTRITNERIGWLQDLRASEPMVSEPAPIAAPAAAPEPQEPEPEGDL